MVPTLWTNGWFGGFSHSFWFNTHGNTAAELKINEFDESVAVVVKDVYTDGNFSSKGGIKMRTLQDLAKKEWLRDPRGFMYGTFTYVYHTNQPFM